MAMGEFSPVFGGAKSTDLMEMPVEDARLLKEYERPKNIRITNITIPGSEVEIPVRVYQPLESDGTLKQGPLPLLLWFHGGAFVMGNLDMGEGEFTSCEVASRGSAVVISVDYRLAHENLRFPCSQIDGFDAAIWAIKHANEFGVDVDRVFIGGGSAGACLSGSVSLMLRDKGIKVAGVIPIYPLAHLELPTITADVMKLVEGIEFFTEEFVLVHNSWLLEGENQQEAFYCFPGDAEDKTGQAPFLVIHAERDSLRMTGQKWVEELRESGIPVDEFVEPGALHGYLNQGPTNASANHTFDLMAKWINAH